MSAFAIALKVIFSLKAHIIDRIFFSQYKKENSQISLQYMDHVNCMCELCWNEICRCRVYHVCNEVLTHKLYNSYAEKVTKRDARV